MKVLVCGAGGFIGRNVVRQLRAAGHCVMAARSRDVDFSRDVDVAPWLPRLAGIDAVVNAVGVLRDSRRRPMDAVHHRAPRALFDACEQAGVRRVLHISALGIEGNGTLYARSKLEAEQALLALHETGCLDATILRPSIVFGRGGASTELFIRLAHLPLLPLPIAALRARVQPVAVGDLADAAVSMLAEPCPVRVDIVGPRPLPLGDFIASLRRQLGRGRARVVPIPAWLSRLSARGGDFVPAQPWCSETLALLQQDNVGDGTAFARLLGRPAVPPEELLHARMSEGR